MGPDADGILRLRCSVMSLTVRRLDPDRHAAWDAFVHAHPDATFFHRAGWRTVIERAFGQRPHFLYAQGPSGIEGVLPLVHVKSLLFGNALISTAFCVSGGPIVATEAAHDALETEAFALMAELKADYIEYRDIKAGLPGWSYKDELYASFVRPMEADEDANLKQIPRKQRAVVRKAIEAPDLTFAVERHARNLYPLYALSVRNLGTPVFTRRYFDALLDVFGEDCDVLTVSHAGTPLASVLNFYFRDRVLPFYTGSDPAARKLGANDLMYWRLMRHAVARGARIFDFGRSKRDTGPFAFKKNWGFEPVPILHGFKLREGSELPNVTPTNPKYALFIAAWKRLPLPVANFVGPLIVRNIG